MSVRRMILGVVGICAGLCMSAVFLTTIGFQWWDQTITGFQTDETDISEMENFVSAIKPADITFPATVTGTDLIAEELVSYDGAFMEDLSFDEVMNVAALLVRNTGDQWVLEGKITLAFGEQKMVFYIQQLPPGQAVLVLEADRQSCKQRNFTALTGWTRRLEHSVSEEALHIESVGSSSLAVTNQTSVALTNVRVYYKTVYADDVFYLGGNAYVCIIARLLPNETVHLQPEYYAGDLSRILRVEYEMKSSFGKPKEDLDYRTLERKSFSLGFFGSLKTS